VTGISICLPKKAYSAIFLNLQVKATHTLIEAKVLIADWRREYNQVRPHSAKGYKPPAPEAKILNILTL
jgi:putative transposase